MLSFQKEGLVDLSQEERSEKKPAVPRTTDAETESAPKRQRSDEGKKASSEDGGTEN